MGLSHDGRGSDTYYQGDRNPSDPTSWGPIMGTGYYNSVSQWSNGDYADATNTQDDVNQMGAAIGYAADEAGETPANAAALPPVAGGFAVSGVVAQRTDVDAWSFSLASAADVAVLALPWTSDDYTAGANLDIVLKLYALPSGSLMYTVAPSGQTSASLSRRLDAGAYAVTIEGGGDPGSYSDYGSLGQYDLSVVVTPDLTTTTTTAATTTAATRATGRRSPSASRASSAASTSPRRSRPSSSRR